MDLLSTVLQSLHMVDSAFAMLERAPPWGLRLDTTSRQQVFVLQPLDAPCHLRVADGPLVPIGRGDTAVVLGERFELLSSPSVPTIPLSHLWPQDQRPALGRERTRPGPLHLRRPVGHQADDTPTHRLLLVALLLQDVAHSPVLGVLPHQLVLRHDTTPLFPWSAPVLRFVEHEADQERPGYEAASQMLAQMVISDIIRTYVLVIGTDRASWMRGIADPQIGKALGLIHNEAGRDWRLETLAEACHMARSTFSRRFLRLVGRSPMDYLCAVRMHQAAERLRAGEQVQQVCAAVGYQSEWAFRKAFTAQFDTSPSQYRKAPHGLTAPSSGLP